MKLPDGTDPMVLSAEEAVVSACLLSDDAYARVATIVSSGDFRSDHLREMFAGIARLARNNVIADVITLGHELAQRNLLDQVGGEPVIQEVVGRWFTAVGVETYARIVKADSVRRERLRALGEEVAAVSRNGVTNWWTAWEEE